MPRKYVRPAGARSYKDYTPEQMKKAINDVLENNISINESAKLNGVKYGSLRNRIANKHGGSVGHPTALSQSEEGMFAEVINSLSIWRTPVSREDLRYLIKDYLDKKETSVKEFSNNLPGLDWVIGFKARHGLNERMAANIKSSRAEINLDSLTEFYNNYATVAEGVPPSNIANFDETNYTNDPGAKKVLCKRGVKRLERKIDFSKSSTSIMYAGFADGTVLPPMIVYKAKSEKCNPAWEIDGPDGALYDASASGWFNMRTYERWFFEIFLPEAKKKSGKKILIGDNLSSHFTIDVIKACNENNIVFIPLLANATHLMQPLDVSFFAPAKRRWRSTLDAWKRSVRSSASIPKTKFPSLLKRLHDTLIPGNNSLNLVKGFKACGLYPIDKHQVIKRLPPSIQNESANSSVLSDTVMTYLETLNNPQTPKKKGGSRRKVNTSPGKAVQLSHFSGPVETSTPYQEKTSKKTGAKKTASKQKPCKKRRVLRIEDSSESECESQEDDAVSNSNDDDDGDISEEDLKLFCKNALVQLDDDNVGSFFAFCYKSPRTYYWARLEKVFSDDADSDATQVEVKFLRRVQNTTDSCSLRWWWPGSEEKVIIDASRCFMGPAVPELTGTSRKSCYSFADENKAMNIFKNLDENKMLH